MVTWEVNRAIVACVDLVDHILKFGLARVLAKGSHNGSELLRCDLTW